MHLVCSLHTALLPVLIHRCRHATQDLAVVVLLMLIPLLAPSETGHHGMAQIFQARLGGSRGAMSRAPDPSHKSCGIQC